MLQRRVSPVFGGFFPLVRILTILDRLRKCVAWVSFTWVKGPQSSRTLNL